MNKKLVYVLLMISIVVTILSILTINIVSTFMVFDGKCYMLIGKEIILGIFVIISCFVINFLKNKI